MNNIKDLVSKKPKWIDAARRIKDRCLFYSERVEQGVGDSSYNDFLDYVQGLLSPNKFDRFKQNFKNKIPALLADIQREYSRAFYAQDKTISVEFSSNEDKARFDTLRKNKINDIKFMREKALPKIMYGANDVILVHPDLSLSFICISTVRYQDEDVLIYEISDNRFAYVDKNVWTVFSIENERMVFERGNTFENTKGIVPFKTFWSDSIGDSKYLMEPTIWKLMPVFDDYLLHENGRFYYELYAKYHVTKMRETVCTYKDESGARCQNGYISRTASNGENIKKECPSCAESKLLYAGSIVSVRPKMSNDSDNWDALEVINVDGVALKFNQDRSKEYKDEIIEHLIGFTEGQNKGASFNAMQIQSMFEKKKQMINFIARNLEKAHQFIIDTTAALAFSTFKSAKVFYGFEHYLKSADDMYSDYEKMSNSDAPQGLLTELLASADYRRFENDPANLFRTRLIRELEPFLHLGTKEVADMYAKGLILYNEFYLKVNFTQLISRFESEFTNLGNLAGKKGVKNIVMQKLYSYITPLTENNLNTDNNVNESESDN